MSSYVYCVLEYSINTRDKLNARPGTSAHFCSGPNAIKLILSLELKS